MAASYQIGVRPERVAVLQTLPPGSRPGHAVGCKVF